MSNIKVKLLQLQEMLKQFPKAKLVVVSKMQPNEKLQEAYDAGHRVFAENKALELRDKFELFPKDVEWHLIGHLQTNKVKYIAPFVACIHSVDSLKLLVEINKQAKKYDRVISCLLQFYIATEETKFGLSLAEAKELLDSVEFNSLQNIRIDGVMGMASFTPDTSKIREEFKHLQQIFEDLKSSFPNTPQIQWKEISMGMSGDYPIALEEGSTMIRVGSAIFQ